MVWVGRSEATVQTNWKKKMACQNKNCYNHSNNISREANLMKLWHDLSKQHFYLVLCCDFSLSFTSVVVLFFSLGEVHPVLDLVLNPSQGVCLSVTPAPPLIHQVIYFCFTVFIIWAPSSEFVSSSIPSWQILTAHAQPFRGARDLAFFLKVPLDSMLV